MTLRTSIILDMKGNLAQNMRQAEQSTRRFGRTGVSSMRRFETAMNRAGRALDGLGNRYTALLTGAAAVGAARTVVQLEERFTRLGIQAGKSADEVVKLKREIFAAARAPGIRVAPTEMIAAAETLQERIGEPGLELFRASRKSVGMAIQAAKARGEDIGAVLSEMFDKLEIDTPEEVRLAFDEIISQGDRGAFTLRKFATQGTRLAAAFAGTGRTGLSAVKELSAVAQAAMKGSANAETAATAFEALFRNLSDPKVQRKLRRLGVELEGPDGKRRNTVDVLKEVIAATGGSESELLQIFDAEAFRAIRAARADFTDKKGGFDKTFDLFTSVEATGKRLEEASERASKTISASLTSLSAAFTDFADRRLSGPLAAAAGLVPEDPATMDKVMNLLFGGAAGLGGIILARKFGLFGRRGGRAGVAGAAGLGGLGSLAPQPVIVMNWPLGLMRGGLAPFSPQGARGRAAASMIGGPGAIAGGAAGGASLSRRSAIRGVGRHALFFGGAIAGLETLQALTAQGQSTLDRFGGVGGAVGGLGGTFAGAKLGAGLGSFAGPLGIAIGGLLGGLAGSVLGDHIGRAAGDALGRTLGHRDESKVTVAFENAPPGMRVRSVESGRGLFLTTDMLRGPQMVTQP
ncbi:MAG: hypothetical protein ACLFWF_14715 [Alphaproteobacteria bacterium]